jgi:hypothetical protein
MLRAIYMPTIVFDDHPEFKPNMTPKEMFDVGIMGGSYFRKIKSPDTGKVYKNHHKKFKSLRGIPDEKVCGQEYDKSINYYGVEVGTSYEFWMSKGWIREDIDPYGWIEWYCNFYEGRRTDDDDRQIMRWSRLAGKKGRFRKQLQRLIDKKHKKSSRDLKNLHPRLRQTLFHWAYDSREMRPRSGRR